jgi:hypothetical protein
MTDPPPVYVDQFPDRGWGRWSGGGHLWCADPDRLHAFAASIGLKREWFQNRLTGYHYDVTRGKRGAAIRAGAVPVTMRELATMMFSRPPVPP